LENGLGNSGDRNRSRGERGRGRGGGEGQCKPRSAKTCVQARLVIYEYKCKCHRTDRCGVLRRPTWALLMSIYKRQPPASTGIQRWWMLRLEPQFPVTIQRQHMVHGGIHTTIRGVGRRSHGGCQQEAQSPMAPPRSPVYASGAAEGIMSIAPSVAYLPQGRRVPKNIELPRTGGRREGTCRCEASGGWLPQQRGQPSEGRSRRRSHRTGRTIP
jgi:hypothetical protein